MAERRMFSKAIIDSDTFLDMPMSSQVLYFHLSMNADDDGFVGNPRKITRMVGCSQDDMDALISKNYIVIFDSGIVAIRHWRMHNYIQKDRYKPTIYREEKALLCGEDDKGSKSDNTMDTPCIQDLSALDTQVSIGKSSIDKISSDKASSDKASSDKVSSDEVNESKRESQNYFTPPTLKEIYDYCNERNNNVSPEKFFDYYTANGWMMGRSKMSDWKAAVRNWENKEYSRPSQPEQSPLSFAYDDAMIRMLEERSYAKYRKKPAEKTTAASDG